MKRKLVNVLTALYIIAVLSMTVFAEGPQLSVSTTEAKTGETVTVTIQITDNSGFMVFNPKIEYDRSRLEYMGFEEAGLTGWTVSEKAAVWLGDEDTFYNGEILRLQYRIRENAPDGFAFVRLGCEEGDAYSASEAPVFFEITNGGVYVGEKTPELDPSDPGHQHIASEATRERETQPTCKDDGSYDEVVYCRLCGTEMSRTRVVLPSAGHSYNDPVFQWSQDSKTAKAVFSCQKGDSEVTVNAFVTEQENGSGKRVLTAAAVMDGKTYTDVKTMEPGTPEPTQELETRQQSEPGSESEESEAATDPNKTPPETERQNGANEPTRQDEQQAQQTQDTETRETISDAGSESAQAPGVSEADDSKGNGLLWLLSIPIILAVLCIIVISVLRKRRAGNDGKQTDSNQS